MKKKWEPPLEGMYKINVDSAFKSVIGQGDGVLLLGTMLMNFWKEALAICVGWPPLFRLKHFALHNLVRAAQLGMSRIILETDAT